MWKTRGWDPEEIVKTANASNSKPHSRWGTVYKIDVEEDSSGTRKEDKQQEKAFVEQSKKKKSSKQSTSSNSSKSSESSAPPKKDKRKDKAKSSKRKNCEDDKEKDDKEKEKAEKIRAKQEASEKRAADTEARKARDKALRKANQAIAKLSPVQLSLSTSMSSKSLKHVPDCAVTQARRSHSTVQGIVAAARKVVQKSGGLFHCEPDELTKVASDVSNADRLMKELLDTATKFVKEE